MKRRLIILLGTFCSLLFLGLCTAFADTTFTVDDWDYTIDDNGSISVSGYHGTAPSVVIPESVEYGGQTYAISTVARNCFLDNTTLKSVTVPARITTIRECAFKNCTFLSELTILGDLTDCSGYSTYYESAYSERLSVNNSVFYNTGTNAGGFSVTFGDGVTRVPAYLFATGYDKGNNVYAHITSLNIADSVREIAPCAFSRCYDLKEVSLGDGVKTLGRECFSMCGDLPSAPMGKSLEVIEESAFAHCTGMTTAHFSESVATIAPYAFHDCSALSDIILNQGLTKIGSYAFLDCTAIRTLVLPSSVQTVDICAFKNCTFLSDLTILGDITDCSGYSTCYESAYSERLSQSNSVFYNAGTNSPSFSVVFGDGVTYIPAYLFATGYDKGSNVYAHVTGVTVADSVREIAPCAFYRCYDLREVSLGDGVKTLGRECFSMCSSLPEAPMGKSLEEIGESAFAHCTGMTKAAFSEAVVRIEPYAFNNCSALSEIALNERLLKIGGYAFLDCTAMKKLVLPASVQTVDICAFKNCTGLSELTILGDLTDCSGYSVNYESAYNERLSKTNSVFYNAGTNSPSFSVAFGEGVTYVPAYLFATGYGKDQNVYAHVTSVYIPESVRSVGTGAFYACYSLKDVFMAGAGTSLEEDVFAYCTSTAFTLHSCAGSMAELYAAEKSLNYEQVAEGQMPANPADAAVVPAQPDNTEGSTEETTDTRVKPGHSTGILTPSQKDPSEESEEPGPEADKGWTCTNGHSGNTGNFCPVCGEARPQENVCGSCGYDFGDEPAPNFCPNCGAKQ